MATADFKPLDKERHIRYWQRCHRSYLPHQYTSHDSTRMALAFFIIAALDILSPPSSTSSANTHLLSAADRAKIRSWVLSLQHPGGGFCGSPNHALPKELYQVWNPDQQKQETRQSSSANIAATYFALLLLALAADGEEAARVAFGGVERVRLLTWLKRLQRSDGSFGQVVLDDGQIMGGRDMRHCYLAAMIRWCLRGDVKEGEDGWVEDINVDALEDHIKRGQTYDGGIAESSQHESHAGYAYCAISAISLLARPSQQRPSTDPDPALDLAVSSGLHSLPDLTRFLVFRQIAYLEADDDEHDESPDTTNFTLPNSLADLTLDENMQYVGFNGRCNKTADTCYCWWVGGTLSMLGKADLINKAPARRFIMNKTQHLIGGFSKYPGGPPDIYHAYLGLAALATMGEPSLKEFDPALCVSSETALKIELARYGLINSAGNSGQWAASRDEFWGRRMAVGLETRLDDVTERMLVGALNDSDK